MTHDCIDRCLEDICLLKNWIVDLEALSGLQQNTLQSCQNTIAGLEETVLKLAASVTILEKSVCRCRDHLLSPAPHYTPGEEEMVKEMEEEEETEEDLLMDNLPSAENTSPVPVPVPVFLGIIPFAVSTGQHCVPLKHLVRKVYHPYKDPVG